MADLAQSIVSRWILTAFDVSTPAKAAETIQSALAPHYRDGYLLVEASRGVGVTAGRMSEEGFAKLRLIEGYNTTGHNPLGRVTLAPGFGSAGWKDLEVRSDKSVVLKALGIKPFRNLSGADPEKAVKAVIAWFTANAKELQDPHSSVPIRY